MDVHCTTCGEPWDTYHLWQDAIFETDLSEKEATAWHSLPHRAKLASRYREKFKEVGWEFGQCVINVIHCPSCPEGATPDLERLHTKAGLASTYADYGF